MQTVADVVLHVIRCDILVSVSQLLVVTSNICLTEDIREGITPSTQRSEAIRGVIDTLVKQRKICAVTVHTPDDAHLFYMAQTSSLETNDPTCYL